MLFLPPSLHGSNKQPAKHTETLNFLSFWQFQGNFPARGHFKLQGEPLSETNRRPHREAAGDLLPDRRASVKAKSGAARAPSQLYTSLILPHCCADTPLSPHESTRTMRLKDPSLPGEIDTPPQTETKASNYPKRALRRPSRLSLTIILNTSAPRGEARWRGVHHQRVFHPPFVGVL